MPTRRFIPPWFDILQAELLNLDPLRKMTGMNRFSRSFGLLLTSALLAIAGPLLAREFQCPGHPYHLSLPEPWEQMKPLETTPASVKLLLRGQGQYEVPPTVNIAVEQLPQDTGPQKYLECVQAIYSTNPLARYTHLGALPGGREPLELVQVQLSTAWGEMELLQGILIRDGKAFIITASARQEEFCEQLPIFIRALQSFDSPSAHELAHCR